MRWQTCRKGCGALHPKWRYSRFYVHRSTALTRRLQPAGLGVGRPLHYRDGFCLRIGRATYLIVTFQRRVHL